MMQGFHREFQGKDIAYYVMRLEGKLNEIQVKHLNRISEAETARVHSRCCCMALGTPLRGDQCQM